MTEQTDTPPTSPASPPSSAPGPTPDAPAPPAATPAAPATPMPEVPIPSTGAVPTPSEHPIAAPEPPDPQGWWRGTGRRKTAVARVRLKPGSGKFDVRVTRKKQKPVTDYFTEERDRSDVVAPLKATDTFGKMDVEVRVNGGGYMGQAGAVMLGVARALKKYDPSLEGRLRDGGYLSRDPRKVERKKPGLAGARRRFQFSKR